ncbi:MAG: transposase [Parahaliea sp.]
MLAAWRKLPLVDEDQEARALIAAVVERLNEEIRWRTRLSRRFPNEASCLQLMSATAAGFDQGIRNAASAPPPATAHRADGPAVATRQLRLPQAAP